MSIAKYAKHQKSRMKRSVATFPNGHQIQADSKEELQKKIDAYNSDLQAALEADSEAKKE